jgi:uncharacterized protein YndB with AHSA1/START domain
MNFDETMVEGREMFGMRMFDAPRELVFKLWTDKDHIAQWWGPNGFTTTTSEMSVKPGGIWRFVMHGPDGVDYPNRIEYLEVVEPERLVYSHASDEDAAAVDFRVTVTFEDHGGKTLLTMKSLFATPEALREVVESYGALEGLKQTLGRLGEYLSQQPGGRT